MIVRPLLMLFCSLATFPVAAQNVNVEIDLTVPTHPVSPWLYGRNNSVSDNPSNPLTAAQWKKLRDAGVRFLRENGGNNATKYNWRRKLSSHPDWYNNVYAHSWDFAAQSIQQNLPDAQGMWAFQLIGKAAMTASANFNDWGYNNSQWWTGVRQNLAGGGVLDPNGNEDAEVNGDPELYLENWTADSTTGILDHWFGASGIGLDSERIRYWNMDNEAEIWEGTHDDVMPTQISAEEFMQRYFAVAKKAREKFPDIKLVGPVTANEWQWYNWAGGPISDGGEKYPWLEFFIKRIAEEQEASGVRLLDVLDIHYYPSSTNVSEVVQYHRVFFDQDYVYPEANGIKNINGNWDDSQQKEYIFQRCREWLEEYIGPDHGVTFSVTETGIPDIGPGGIAVWYAGTLGEFMRQPDMEIFAPWHWYPQMWEVLHLFSRYNKADYLNSTSSDEEIVSAYSTINADEDSITVVLVNRATTGTKEIALGFNGYVLANEAFQVLKLSGLADSETFVSHENNALQKSTVQPSQNKISVSLPALSVTSVILKGAKGEVVTGIEKEKGNNLWDVYPNPSREGLLKVVVFKPGVVNIRLHDINGKEIDHLHKGKIAAVPFVKVHDISGLPKGSYIVTMDHNGRTHTRKFIR